MDLTKNFRNLVPLVSSFEIGASYAENLDYNVFQTPPPGAGAEVVSLAVSISIHFLPHGFDFDKKQIEESMKQDGGYRDIHGRVPSYGEHCE
jgi:hypothetical protein